ncbi:MAG TPA: class I mannose-6-phosphate isomerase [Phycisphaerales bacterium]|nr:class I mannose-6-phosphate isomerase [Phycisphaerales bacterium]
MPGPAPPHPLTLAPILLPKVWGGRRLVRLGKPLPPAELIGESWELADLEQTSLSGAGGGARRSLIASGPLAGMTIRHAAEAWGPGLLGPDHPPSAPFPLLVKYLDARENLSVQVHPSPAYARSNPGAHLKTECWLVLEAEPGAVIYKGLRRAVSPADLAAAARDGALPGLLHAEPAVPGQMHLLPSGTIHALGAGVLVAEVQTPSDTTFRLFDWGRAGRELHLDEAVECYAGGAAWRAPAPTWLGSGGAAGDPGARHGRLVETAFFTVDAARLGAGGGLALAACLPATTAPVPAPAPLVLMLVAGGPVRLEGHDMDPHSLTLGQTCLVPAGVAPRAWARAEAAATLLLVALGPAGAACSAAPR